MKNRSLPPPKKKIGASFEIRKRRLQNTASVPSEACLSADSHYTSRIRSVAERHRSVKFSHV